ncbi:MAG: hypothetical protein M3Q03_16445, partial [Chloroflexota bacterium]|nr:hypothetical protein [Chloroflexota bacterium]
MAGKLVVVSGLALALSTSVGAAAAEQAGKENYFARHPGPAGGQTGVDAFDLYAPVDLSPVLLTSGFTATEITGGWEAPPAASSPRPGHRQRTPRGPGGRDCDSGDRERRTAAGVRPAADRWEC